jgi:integral membrane sensor domain MASE1
VLGFVAAAITATAVSGIGGTLGFKVFHGSTAPLLTTWQLWFASDGLGIITVAPLLIELAPVRRARLAPSEVVEGVVAVAALGQMSGLVIFQRWELLATVGPACWGGEQKNQVSIDAREPGKS